MLIVSLVNLKLVNSPAARPAEPEAFKRFSSKGWTTSYSSCLNCASFLCGDGVRMGRCPRKKRSLQARRDFLTPDVRHGNDALLGEWPPEGSASPNRAT
jgi:hypothetical protein